MSRERRTEADQSSPAVHNQTDTVQSVLDDVLTAQQGRHLQTVLVAADRPLPVSAIVDHLFVGIDQPIPPAALPRARRHYRELLVSDVLPLLVEAGLVEYNHADDTVRATSMGKRQLQASTQTGTDGTDWP